MLRRSGNVVRLSGVRGLGAAGFSVFTSGYPLSSVPVGAVWGVDITGAQPNAQVSIQQLNPQGQTQIVSMGATDAAGNFTMRQNLYAGSEGTWHSTWLVGPGQTPVGSYTFTSVSSAPAPAPAPAPSPQPAPGPSVSTVSPAPTNAIQSGPTPGVTPATVLQVSPAAAVAPAEITDFLTQPFGPLPLWGWLAAAGAGFLFLGGSGGGRRRH